MKRLELTRHTVRCPLEHGTASLTVRTDPRGHPSRRHLHVMDCSLLPTASFTSPARSGFFSDLAPPLAYLHEIDSAPRHSLGVACPRRCLAVLNAAEPGAEPGRCTSGVGDSLELARRTQRPAITRLLWLYGA